MGFKFSYYFLLEIMPVDFDFISDRLEDDHNMGQCVTMSSTLTYQGM
jgi:hypothetical protein